MDDRPRNLRAMLAEVKDLSELMVDLAYAALYFGDPDMAEEVGELEERMDALVHDLSNAEEVSHRVRVRDGSHLARRPLADLELPVQTGMRIVAIRRDREWITDVEGEEILMPSDVLFLRGSPAGIVRLRELAAAPHWEPPTPPEDGTLTDLDRAIDVLVEMKNISEAAVGLAYSALVLRDLGLAAEVRHLEDRLDEMKDRLELWVLRAGDELIASGPDEGHPLLAARLGWRLEEDEDTGQERLEPLQPATPV